MKYSPLLLQHFHHPQYVGELAPDVNVFTAQAAISGGDKVQLSISIRNHIQDIAYQVYGCPAMIACMSWLATQLIHQNVQVAQEIKAAKMGHALGLPNHKLRCALLAEQVLKKVLKDSEGFNLVDAASTLR